MGNRGDSVRIVLGCGEYFCLWGVEMKYEITKGSEKDFEGAPDGYLQVIKLIGGTRRGFVESFDYMCKYQGKELGDEGRVSNPTLWEIIAERRPITEPVWSGEGLPPVGVECEFTSFSSGDVWHTGVVRYLSEHTIVIEFTDMVNGKAESISHPRTMKFRPLRSPEDVARDEAIEAMRDVGYTLPAAIRFTKEEMAALYDAGYRKME